MTLPDLNRSLIRTCTVPIVPGTKVNTYKFASTSALAILLADGFFNFARLYLQVGDVIDLIAGHGGNEELATVRVTAVPASGDVTVAADLDEAAGAARAVVPTADGLTTGLLLATDTFVSVASADAAHIITLPAIADVALGKEIWGKLGGTACEIRTPATSNTKINGGDADSNESVLAANATFMAKKVAADEWTVLTFVGGALAAPIPD